MATTHAEARIAELESEAQKLRGALEAAVRINAVNERLDSVADRLASRIGKLENRVDKLESDGQDS